MRVIKVEADNRSERWILWMLAGTAIGVTAGVLAAEKFSGRDPKGLLRRARTLVKTARDQWGPMLTLALELRDAFGSRSNLGARYDDVIAVTSADDVIAAAGENDVVATAGGDGIGAIGAEHRSVLGDTRACGRAVSEVGDVELEFYSHGVGSLDFVVSQMRRASRNA